MNIRELFNEDFTIQSSPKKIKRKKITSMRERGDKHRQVCTRL